MKLIVLDKDATREFTCAVKVNVPGESEPAFFDVTYVELPRDQITVLSEAPVGTSRAALRKYAERADNVARKIIAKVSGVVDADGKEIPWTPALLEALLQRPYIREAMIGTYTRQIMGERELGN